MQTEIILFKNSQNPLVGTVAGSSWAWPGVALSANTYKLHANYLRSANLRFSRWVLVWNPQVIDTVGFSPTGVRLVKFDDGPTNIQQIAVVNSPSGRTYNSPKVDSFDVTLSLQQILWFIA